VSLPGPHPASLPVDTLLAECAVRRFRGSGPGGQHRNKVETGVAVVHTPSQVTGEAGERRHQEENLRVAVFRLRVNLALRVRRPYALGAEPGVLWRSRVREGRIAVNPKHADFPAILAEALDVIATLRFDLTRAAAVLGCTMSQLIKLLKREPRALGWVNEQRQVLGLRRLL
jgi:hypothetical protein